MKDKTIRKLVLSAMFAAGIVLAVLLEQAVCRMPGLMRPSGKNCT